MVVLVGRVWWCSRSQTYQFCIVMRYLVVGYLVYMYRARAQRSVIEQLTVTVVDISIIIAAHVGETVLVTNK